MANTRPKQHTETLTFRLSEGEKSAVEKLAELRAKEAAEQGYDPDASAGAWLRFVIRREAKAAGIPTESDAAPSPPPPRRTAKGARAARRG